MPEGYKPFEIGLGRDRIPFIAAPKDSDVYELAVRFGNIHMVRKLLRDRGC